MTEKNWSIRDQHENSLPRFLCVISQNALNCFVFAGWSFTSARSFLLGPCYRTPALPQAQGCVAVTLGAGQARSALVFCGGWEPGCPVPPAHPGPTLSQPGPSGEEWSLDCVTCQAWELFGGAAGPEPRASS